MSLKYEPASEPQIRFGLPLIFDYLEQEINFILKMAKVKARIWP